MKRQFAFDCIVVFLYFLTFFFISSCTYLFTFLIFCKNAVYEMSYDALLMSERITDIFSLLYLFFEQILKKLLFYSWKIDSEDSSGRMAIHIAAEYGNHKCVALLAEENEVHALAVKDRNGRTALHLAVISQS